MTKREEADRMKDAILNGRDRRKEISDEWKALGLEPRIQSPAELRRVLMTWSKGDLVNMLIRAESDAIKSRVKQLEYHAAANEIHTNTLVLPDDRKRYELGFSDRFNAWLIQFTKGQTLDARLVFLEGWKARARAEEAIDLTPAPRPSETERQTDAD